MWTVACGGCRRCPLRGANPGGPCAADARSGVPTWGAVCGADDPSVVAPRVCPGAALPQPCGLPCPQSKPQPQGGRRGEQGSRTRDQGSWPPPRTSRAQAEGTAAPQGVRVLPGTRGGGDSVSSESPVRFACRCFALWGTPLTPVTGPQFLPMRGPGAACEQPQEEGGLAVPAPLVAHAPPPCDERPHWSRPLVCPSGAPARPVLSGKDARSLAPRQGLPLASGSQGTRMNRSEPERARATWAEWLQAVRPRPSSGATTSSSAAGPPLPCAPARPCHLLARRLAPCQPPHYSCEPGERGSGLAGE